MGQKIREDKVGALSHNSGNITMTALESNPAWLTIGGQQYKIISSLSRAISLDVTLAANTGYQVFAVVSNGVASLRISTNNNDTGPSGFAVWKLVGSFISNGSAAFGSFNSADLANGFISQVNLNPVGMIVSSMLTESQFQAINGTSWILADGRSVAGSAYASVTSISTAPDLRGMVLRGKNNGRADGNQDPDGERALNSFQNHAFAGHSHGGATGGQSSDHQHIDGFAGVNAGGSFGVATVGGGGNINQQSGQSVNNHALTSGVTANHAHAISAEGGNETRMRNVAVNYFIKIN